MPHSSTVSRTESALLVVDVQARLAPAIADRERILRRIGLLLEAARALEIPVLASEQAPDSLGPTLEPLRALLPADAIVEKRHFSCLREPNFAGRWQALGRRQAVVCGMEAHVCVAQTALDLAARGVETFVVADAVGSRSEANRNSALQRVGLAGLVPVPAESVVFEWLGDSGQPAFRGLIRRIKDEGSS